MPTFAFTHRCGHAGREYLTRSDKYRFAWFVARGEGRDCTECYRKNLIIARLAATEEAADIAKKTGLPALLGSDKQIAWAETLRMNFINSTCNDVKRWINQYMSSKPSLFNAEKVLLVNASVESKLTDMASESSSKAWIDNRSKTSANIYEEIAGMFCGRMTNEEDEW